MRRLPIASTIVVALAVAAMIALGMWQLQRRSWKEALLAHYSDNLGKPAIALPTMPDDAALFRSVFATCTRVTGWSREAGRDRSGGMGWRQIAQCGRDVGAPFAVQVGVSRDPAATPRWSGGDVAGYITHAPDHRPLIEAAFDSAPRAEMIVAARPLEGLAANPAPDLSSVPNNHLAYAVQWFLFAGIAVVIYALALRGRFRRQAPPRR